MQTPHTRMERGIADGSYDRTNSHSKIPVHSSRLRILRVLISVCIISHQSVPHTNTHTQLTLSPLKKTVRLMHAGRAPRNTDFAPGAALLRPRHRSLTYSSEMGCNLNRRRRISLPHSFSAALNCGAHAHAQAHAHTSAHAHTNTHPHTPTANSGVRA